MRVSARRSGRQSGVFVPFSGRPDIETMHTLETTLEDVFVQVTGAACRSVQCAVRRVEAHPVHRKIFAFVYLKVEPGCAYVFQSYS